MIHKAGPACAGFPDSATPGKNRPALPCGPELPPRLETIVAARHSSNRPAYISEWIRLIGKSRLSLDDLALPANRDCRAFRSRMEGRCGDAQSQLRIISRRRTRARGEWIGI